MVFLAVDHVRALDVQQGVEVVAFGEGGVVGFVFVVVQRLGFRFQSAAQRSDHFMGVLLQAQFIVARFNFPALVAVLVGVVVVEGSDVAQPHIHGHDFTFTRIEQSGFAKARQGHFRFFNAALGVRRVDIELHNFLARFVASVGHFHLDLHFVIQLGSGVHSACPFFGSGHKFLAEAGVGQAVAEGIHNFFVIVKAFKVARLGLCVRGFIVLVTHVNTFFVFNGFRREHGAAQIDFRHFAVLHVANAGVIFRSLEFARYGVDFIVLIEGAEILPGRIGGKVPGEDIHQSSRGIHFTLQNLGNRFQAGQTGLADPQNRVDRGIFHQIADFHGVGNVEQYHHFVKVFFHVGDHIFFIVVQLEIMLGFVLMGGDVLGIQVVAFTAGTGDGDDGQVPVQFIGAHGGVQDLGGGFHRLRFIAHGVCGRFDPVVFIHGLHFVIDLETGRFHAVGQGGIDTAAAAGAGAAGHGIKGAGAKKRHVFDGFCQRQDAIVLEQYGAFLHDSFGQFACTLPFRFVGTEICIPLSCSLSCKCANGAEAQRQAQDCRNQSAAQSARPLGLFHG